MWVTTHTKNPVACITFLKGPYDACFPFIFLLPKKEAKIITECSKELFRRVGWNKTLELSGPAFPKRFEVFVDSSNLVTLCPTLKLSKVLEPSVFVRGSRIIETSQSKPKKKLRF
jgi:hypothetical protein